MRRVKGHLMQGRNFLSGLKEVETYNVPDVQPNLALINSGAPKNNDPYVPYPKSSCHVCSYIDRRFYVATDERDPKALEHFKSQGAVLLPDLITMDDRRTLGWPLMLTDVRAIVEQELLSHAAYFSGVSVSSVSGGILNMRAVHGGDGRAVSMD